jgi:hypothetical protein
MSVSTAIYFQILLRHGLRSYYGTLHCDISTSTREGGDGVVEIKKDIYLIRYVWVFQKQAWKIVLTSSLQEGSQQYY